MHKNTVPFQTQHIFEHSEKKNNKFFNEKAKSLNKNNSNLWTKRKSQICEQKKLQKRLFNLQNTYRLGLGGIET